MYWWFMRSHGFGQWGYIPLIFLAWSLFITGVALWYAAKRQEKGWFIFFLLIHTLGIIELIYLVFVAKVFASGSSSTKRRITSPKRRS